LDQSSYFPYKIDTPYKNAQTALGYTRFSVFMQKVNTKIYNRKSIGQNTAQKEPEEIKK